MPSVLQASVQSGVENESCVLPAYVTTASHVAAQLAHMRLFADQDWLPIFWEVDVADEWNGWFSGLALSYCDARKLIRVALPDEHQPVFEGEIPLDWRVLRLKRCRDADTTALFNKIVRQHVTQIKWDVDWYEPPLARVREAGLGAWRRSVARVYIPILNTLLVEDHHQAPHSSTNYVALTVEKNIRLRGYHGTRGAREFECLIFDEGVKCTEHAREQIKHPNGPSTALPPLTTANKRRECVQSPLRENKPPGNRKLSPYRQGRSQCVVCLSDSPTNIAFVPCGHQVLCGSCQQDSVKRRDMLCPVCRQVIRQRLTVYSS